MKRKNRIEIILSDNLELWSVEVQDISSQHKGHNNFTGDNETHFSILLNPKEKSKLDRIAIHRKINYLLESEFSTGLHALEIKINN